MPGPLPRRGHLPEHRLREKRRLAGVPQAHPHELGEEDPEALVEGGDIRRALVDETPMGAG